MGANLVRDALCWPPRKVAAKESRKEGNSSRRVVRDDAFCLDSRFREVQKQTVPSSYGSKVGPDDREVLGQDFPDRLQLDDDEVGDEEIQAVKADLYPAVEDRDRDLAREGNRLPAKLDRERVLAWISTDLS